MSTNMQSPTQGVYLRFFMHENRRYHGVLLYEWLLREAKKLGIAGGTAFRSIAGYGRHGVLHEAHFLELAGSETVRVDFVVTATDADRLMQRVREERLQLFYAKLPTEFGVLGGDAPG
jgi:PII-like signaling protein